MLNSPVGGISSAWARFIFRNYYFLRFWTNLNSSSRWRKKLFLYLSRFSGVLILTSYCMSMLNYRACSTTVGTWGSILLNSAWVDWETGSWACLSTVSIPKQCLINLIRQMFTQNLVLFLFRVDILKRQGMKEPIDLCYYIFKLRTEHRIKREDIHRISFVDQRALFKEERTRQLLNVADKIIEGKRKKMKGPIDEENAIQEEINKIPDMSEDLMMVQIFTRPHWTCQANSVLPSDYKMSHTCRSRVFTDLWGKGYYITAGEKFGGDFLVYPGDPVKFHSHYIAVCVEQHQLLTPRFLVQKGRLGTGVKKTVLLCSVNELGEISYQSLNWNGK
nr:EOG090X0G6M [Simocephalus serrulatus]